MISGKEYYQSEDPADYAEALPRIAFCFGEHSFNVWNQPSQSLVFSPKAENSIDIPTSDDGKTFVIRAEVSIGHVLLDTIYSIAIYNKVFPDHKIIVLVPFSKTMFEAPPSGVRPAFMRNDSIWDFVKKVALEKGLDIEIIYFPESEDANVTIKNFYAIDGWPVGHTLLQNNLGTQVLREFTRSIAKVDNELSPRRVYVSRRKTIPRNESAFTDERPLLQGVERPRSKTDDDKRVLEEKYVEDLFLELGFEIVYSEAIENYEDQVQLFSECSVVAGVTGAGLNGQVFMKPGSTVIEVSAAIWAYFSVSLHDVYKHLANYLEHSFIAIPAINDRSGKNIAEKIRKNKALYNYLKDVGK